MHDQDMLLMANTYPGPALTYTAHLLDVIGARQGIYGDPLYTLHRVLAHHKPVSSLEGQLMDEDVDPRDREAIFHRALVYAVFPGGYGWDDSARTEMVRPLYRKYGPALRALAEAGWEPVTHARAAGGRLRVERFGSYPELFFSAHNESQELVETHLALAGEALALPPEGIEVTEVISGRRLPARGSGSNWELDISLPPGETAALAVRPCS